MDNFLELLSPAKNFEQGREAINHGADAVYIGAPSFGARVAAGNSIEDIEKLCRYAHIYDSRVFVTVNTLLFDNEIEEASAMLHRLYNAGADAAIIQDLGLLECDLPPIELHASTQTHNATPERVHFMEQVGFKRVILARETSLSQMREIRNHTSCELEAFVQGALCVSYSGQCYMSQYLNGRSGNRGCCSQPCRSTYDLLDEHGNILRKSEHLLSLKDFSAARHLAEMADAGICSFKIEGRLKDMGYVKNVTAYYRRLLDDIMSADGRWHPASSGRCEFFFMPDLEKTFNRGFTDYFLSARKQMATMSTQKSIGKRLGQVTRIERNTITLKSREPLTAGDGLCFFDAQGLLQGFYVNQVNGTSFQPNRMPEGLEVGVSLWRNHDQAFEKQLLGHTCSRKITVKAELEDAPEGLKLTLTDSDGCTASALSAITKEKAQNPLRAMDQITKQLSKMGDTAFEVGEMMIFGMQCTDNKEFPYFIPMSVINELRRTVVNALEESRLIWHQSRRGHCPSLEERQLNNAPYFETELDYKANVLNAKMDQFYRRHGANIIEYGLESTHNYSEKALMTTKYCIRYELGECLKNPQSGSFQGVNELYLRNNKNYFKLGFDCKNCCMRVFSATKIGG